MRIAVVGGSGYIGSRIYDSFKSDSGNDVIIVGRKGSDVPLDLSDIDSFEFGCLNGMDLIIFTAAVSGPDICAKEYESSWKINVTGTSAFIKAAIKRGCRVLFFSSDAVYGDIQGKIYTEEDEAQPCTAYGKMKRAVEKEFEGEPLFKAVRLSYVVSENDKFISYCLSCMRKGEIADIFHPFYRSCVTMQDVVKTVNWLKDNFDNFWSSYLNVCGMELVSRVRIADELNRIFGGKLKYEIAMMGDEFFANRPRFTQMKSNYLYQNGILQELSFSEKIAKELEDIKL